MKKLLLITLITLFSLSSYADSTQSDYKGKLISKRGNIVKIKLDLPASLKTGDRYNVYKFFRKQLFGMNTSGWLHAAVAEITGIKNKVVTLRIIEYKSKMTVNKKRVVHLKPGVAVKLNNIKMD